MLPKYTYLYGYTKETVEQLKYETYINALYLKIGAATGLSKRLLQPHFMNRDTQRINAVQKAIKFNQQLLDELE